MIEGSHRESTVRILWFTVSRWKKYSTTDRHPFSVWRVWQDRDQSMSYYHKRSWHENYEKTWSDPRRCKLPYRLKSMRNVAEEIMAQVNLSSETAKQSETLAQLRCVAGWADGIHKPIITLSIINIFLSITAFLGNFLILVALHKESSLHSPSKFLYRCLATTDLCVGLISEPSAVMYWLSLVNEYWNFCLFMQITHFVAGFILASVSLLTMTAVSVDRLLALILGLGYKQVVTLKRTHLLLIIFWIVSSILGATSSFVNHRIAIRFSYVVIGVCLITTTVSYMKIFHGLHHNQNQLQAHVQPVPLNMARYREAVHSALWVQLALVVCYLPYGIVTAVLPEGRASPFEFLVSECVETLVYLNSSLNPFLYCWRITEVRQAVKETIRRALCFPQT